MATMAKRKNLSSSSRPSSGPAKRGASSRPSWMAMPPRHYAAAGWALLPLRAFLGFTFVFAGLQKFANPNFFDANSPGSIHAQLIGAARNSPISFLLGRLTEHATPLGVLIALGEVAVGLGILLGLWTRIAALGGLVISLSLFLSVSFHQNPFYTGSDIVFTFAFMPLVIAGAGVLSLDAFFAAKARAEAGAPDPTIVPIEFGTVREVCGKLVGESCSARNGDPCSPKGCPFLVGSRAPLAERRELDGVDRRAAILGASAAGATAVAVAISAGASAGIGRAVGGAPTPKGGGTGQLKPSTSTTKPSTGGGSGKHAIGAASAVAVGSAATFQNPINNQTGIVLHATAGEYRAFDAICNHAGCVVTYSKPNDLFVCPCHGSEFSAQTGKLELGPATAGLKEYPCTVGSDGQLYITA